MWWIIATGREVSLWDRFQEQGIAAIGLRKWHLGDLRDYGSKEVLGQRLIERAIERNIKPSRSHNIRAAKAFGPYDFEEGYPHMEIGDTLIAGQRPHTILGWGVVTGDYVYDPKQPMYKHLRKVEWSCDFQPVDILETLPQMALSRCNESVQAEFEALLPS